MCKTAENKEHLPTTKNNNLEEISSPFGGGVSAGRGGGTAQAGDKNSM